MNKLDRLAEFKLILANYKVSEESKRILTQTQLVLLVAPTSAGRNTIIRELLKTGKYHFIISDTTRTPRINDGVPEQDGVHYWFRSEEEVLRDLKAGKYLEAEIIHGQQVSGVSIRELQEALQERKIPITDMDIGGVLNVIEAKPDTHAMLVLPPGFEEWQRRIMSRGEMSEVEHRRRMRTALKIFAAALEHDHFTFIVNDVLDEAVQEIHELVSLNRPSPESQARAKKLAERLLLETQAFLDSSK